MSKKVIVLFVILSVLICVTAVNSQENVKYLGDIEPKSIITDGELQINQTYLGLPITVGGEEYDKGISMHPLSDSPAEVVYNIEGLGYKFFYAVGGKDKTSGSAVGGDSGINGTKIGMQVWVDNVLIEDSGNLAYPSTHTFNVNVANAKTVKLVVTDGGDGLYCDTTSWADAHFRKDESTIPTKKPTEEPTNTPTQGPIATPDPSLANKDKVYISDIEWITSHSYENSLIGNYAHRDENNAKEELWIGGEFFSKGICMHGVPGAESYVDVNIENLGFTTFAAQIGISETMLYDVSMASVIFIVYVDGIEKFRSENMTLLDLPQRILVDITDGKKLRLAIADGGNDGISGDWGAYANAVITKLTDEDEIFKSPIPEATPTPTSPPTLSPTIEKTVLPGGSSKGSNKSNTPIFLISIISAVLVITIIVYFIIKKGVKKQ